MKKKLLAVITALALCLTLTPAMAFANDITVPPDGGDTAPEGGTTKPTDPGTAPGTGGTGGNAGELEDPGGDNPNEPVIEILTVTRDSETTATITFESGEDGMVIIGFKGSNGIYDISSE